MYRQMFFVPILSILFCLLLFFYLSNTSPKTLISINFHQENLIQSNISPTKFLVNQYHKEPIIFSKSQYLNHTRKPSENVICYLVASVAGDVRLAFNPYPRLRDKVLQLDERLGDSYSTDVIIFHTGYPFRGDLLPIIEGSRRQIEFVNIDHIFYKFSPGFDPHIRDPTWAQKGKWNYHHMCYFWFTQVFKLKIMQRYRYMMRLDDDSQIMGKYICEGNEENVCSLGKWPNVFDLMIKHQAFYMANQREVDFEYILPGMARVRNLTIDYMNKKNLTARNPEMYADIFNKTWEIPNFWNNIEIVDLAFIRRPDVADFMQAIDDSKGIFLYRWGDAPLRYITLAIFTNTSEVLHRSKLELGYCHPC